MSLVIDNGFRPDISEFAGSRGRSLMEVWQMDPVGTPVAGIEGAKTALWYGTRYNHNDETISVVMSLPEVHKLPQGIRAATYFFGLPARATVEISPVPTEAMVDAATFLWTPPTDHLPLKYLFETISSYVPQPR